MKLWLSSLPCWLQQGSDCVLVTVVQVQGSTPREAGASMLLRLANNTGVQSAQLAGMQQVDTIGGGHLEWQACHIAQQMLQESGAVPVRLERFNLGARLGQCCGGLALLVFEKILASQLDSWQQRRECLTTPRSAGNTPYSLQRQLQAGHATSQWTFSDQDSVQTETAVFCVPSSVDAQDWYFEQTLLNHQFHVVVFGAGHVGQAVVQALLPLQASICWVDVRDQVFPAWSHPDLSCISTDTPEYEIEHAPANSYFLIMTHNHALDLALCHALFKRHDYAYFGLIGSHSKRAIFERRLRQRGVLQTQLEQMICPIGVQGIHSKEPAAIAIAVVAQLLQMKSLSMQTVKAEVAVPGLA
ncbi:xanthine dehydrogenase accessory protein XdhC [Alkanindiges illinoisensis]|uniref:xanthine dehydrogenase accessory protein XdhC n=1 Tax=Alkanindiges illinoisensis TaxID=197183 RepID=UPI000688963B|nr:xanthine dehydrogenase accessory protein XdhC [Alkanindiges illinoisensis]